VPQSPHSRADLSAAELTANEIEATTQELVSTAADLDQAMGRFKIA